MTSAAATWLAVLIGIVAWLTASATAVRSVSRIWLRHWAERRLQGAAVAEIALDRPQRLLASASIGIATAIFLAGAVVGWSPAPGWAPAALRAVVVLLLVVVIGQLLPRAVARRWPAALSAVLLPMLRIIDVLTAPLRVAASALARPKAPAANRSPQDEAREDIEDLLRDGELEGVGRREEIAIIAGVVQFGVRAAKDVMTPRADIFALDAATPPGELAQRIAQSGYSRVPLFRASLDEIVGMAHAFDVLKAGGDAAPPVRPVAQTAPSTPCSDLLVLMLRRRLHMAIVRDDSGATLGLVTLDDLLSELVGDIRDEHDEPATVT